jgi:hypothetical protein
MRPRTKALSVTPNAEAQRAPARTLFSMRPRARCPATGTCREVFSLGNRMTACFAGFASRSIRLVEGARIISFRPGSGGRRECCSGAWGGVCCERRSRLRLPGNVAPAWQNDKRIFRAAVAMSAIAQIWRTSRPSAPGRDCVKTHSQNSTVGKNDLQVNSKRV